MGVSDKADKQHTQITPSSIKPCSIIQYSTISIINLWLSDSLAIPGVYLFLIPGFLGCKDPDNFTMTLGQILDFPSNILDQTLNFTISDENHPNMSTKIKINHVNSEPETQPDHEPLNHTNIELESESDSEQSDNSFEEHPSEVSLTDSVH